MDGSISLLMGYFLSHSSKTNCAQAHTTRTYVHGHTNEVHGSTNQVGRNEDFKNITKDNCTCIRWMEPMLYTLHCGLRFFSSKKNNGYDTHLLAISPLEDGASLNAQEHHQFLKYVLELFGLSWQNVAFLIGDNVSTNKSLSRITNIPFIGCASHRFNLAIRDILKTEQFIIDKVLQVMVRLHDLLLSAKLRRLTHLRPVLSTETRWSSVYEMLRRYIRIREHLSSLDSEEIDDIALTNHDNRRVDTLMKQLEPLESVTKALQDDTTTVSDARALFDAVTEKFPGTANRLSSFADIIHNLVFDNTILKLQRGNRNALSGEELQSIR